MDGKALADFLSLPVDPDGAWQGGVSDVGALLGMPTEDSSDESSAGVGLILWRCDPSELVHARPMIPDAGEPIDQFVDTMLELSDAHDATHRPARIDCNDRQLADALGEQLEGSGTVVHFRAKMGAWNAVMQDLTDRLEQATTAPALPSLREAGCSDEQITRYATAAAAFYRAGLWELLDDTDLIKIETPRPPRNLKHAVVLGAGGQSYGLGFYNNPEDHYALMAQEADPRDLELFSFTYDSPDEVVSDDVTLWQELDLPLETGEAFPDVNLLSGRSADGSRRPTPKELDFLTIVLQGLAETTEEEIDSGQWTKWVTITGRRRKCVFSIPNLLDPPDREEWLRRGKMPDRRGNEIHFRMVNEFIAEQGEGMGDEELQAAINAHFVGVSPDSYELPRNTPAERAEAICQQVYASHGRQRVLLAREALAEDPTHVEAGILLAELTRSVDRRLELFQNAKQSAAAALGDDMQELAGDFWGFHETRPFMRACHGLAHALQEAGRVNEAIEQYREMLRLNPNDNQGVRSEIVPLLLEHERDDEAAAILDEYPEEMAQWLYTKALVEFRRRGRSATSKKALRAAFKANPHVMTQLQSDEPPLMPDSYSVGSPEEAAICLDELQAVWDETPGCLAWMFQEYFAWEKDQSKRRREQKRRQAKKKSKRGWRRK